MKIQTRAVNLQSNLQPVEAGIVALLSLIKPTGVVMQKTVLTYPQGIATAQFLLNKNRAIYPGSYTGRVSITIKGEELTDQTSIDVR